MTLPVLVVRERATAEDQQRLRLWLENWQPAYLAGLVKLMVKYDAFGECRACVQQHLDAGRQALMMLPLSVGRSGLAALTEFLAEQTEALGVIY